MVEFPNALDDINLRSRSYDCTHIFTFSKTCLGIHNYLCMCLVSQFCHQLQFPFQSTFFFHVILNLYVNCFLEINFLELML